MKTSTLALIAAAGLAVTACGASSNSDNPSTPVWAEGPVIESMGRAYVEVAPNRGRFSVTYQGKAESSDEASKIAVDKANAASEAMRIASEDNVRITANLSVRPYYEQITRTRRYGGDEVIEELVENVHPDALAGYVADVSVNVTMLAPELTDATRGAALAGGPVNAGSVYFFLEPTAENQRAAFEAAALDARERAEGAAEAAGARLGKTLILREGFDSCLGVTTTDTGYADYPVAARAQAAPPPPPPPPPAPRPAPGSPADLLERAESFKLAADPTPKQVSAEVCAIYRLQ